MNPRESTDLSPSIACGKLLGRDPIVEGAREQQRNRAGGAGPLGELTDGRDRICAYSSYAQRLNGRMRDKKKTSITRDWALSPDETTRCEAEEKEMRSKVGNWPVNAKTNRPYSPVPRMLGILQNGCKSSLLVINFCARSDRRIFYDVKYPSIKRE